MQLVEFKTIQKLSDVPNLLCMLKKAEIKTKNNDVELKFHHETAWKHNSTQKQVEYNQKRIDVIFYFEAKWRRFGPVFFGVFHSKIARR